MLDCEWDSAVSKSPYQVYIKNDSDHIKRAVLFGFDDYFDVNNYGSDPELEIRAGTPADKNGYRRLLAQSATHPFNIGLWRLSCQNIKQLDETFVIHYFNANNRMCEDPLFFEEHKGAEQKTIRQKRYPVKVDSNTKVYLKILPKTILTISIFPGDVAETIMKSDKMRYDRFADTRDDLQKLVTNIFSLIRAAMWLACVMAACAILTLLKVFGIF